MNEIATLCYMNLTKGILKNTDFNFDDYYKFEISRKQNNDGYVLNVNKLNKPIPKNFFTSNITSLNVLVGKNGSGKTTALETILFNINIGITARNEGIVYIIRNGDKYIVYHNYLNLDIKVNDNEIDICMERDLSGKKLRNSDFFRNFIFYSGYFGDNKHLGRGLKFVIDVSKDYIIKVLLNSEIQNYIKLNEIDYDFNIQNLYKNYIFKNIIELVKKKKELLEKVDIKLPSLIKIDIECTDDEEDELNKIYENNKKYFGNNSEDNVWINNYRLEKLITFNGYAKNEDEFYHEAAINYFSVRLMYHWKKDDVIDEKQFYDFIKRLRKVKKLNGINIINNILEKNSGKLNEVWNNFYEIFSSKKNQFISNNENGKNLCYKWDNDEIESIKYMLDYSNKTNYFKIELLQPYDKSNGIYSSGNFGRLSYMASLYAAEKELENNIENKSPNILLLLDEMDAFYHPQFQVNLISELLKYISVVFAEYNVQIVLATNTPLELSDIPGTNITYLDEGKNIKNNKVETFGANINKMLEDSFFLDSTIGSFAKGKIDTVIKHLINENSENITKEEASYVISIIEEPVIQNKLKEMYNKKYPKGKIIDENSDKHYRRLKNEPKDNMGLKKENVDDLKKNLKDILKILDDLDGEDE